MDERREEREELEALERDVEDLRREQEAEQRFWSDDDLIDNAAKNGEYDR